MKILMVCLGNICRSPMAEGIMKNIIDERGLNWKVDSAGTGSWHTGEMPDARARSMASQRGIDISGQRARQVTSGDFDDYDLILAMDRSNLHDLQSLARDNRASEKVRAITDFAPDCGYSGVPDPYYDGSFEEVFGLLEKVCRAAVDEILNQKDSLDSQ